MGAPAVALAGRPTLRFRGASYPVVLPTARDPRLHLAAVIVSLQVLGQVAFEFRLSIAQILISLGVCAVLEVGIAFRRQGVIMWPASALLTGNGVAFILRVPGTEHGQWWSLRGWWIFAGTAAVSLLSKHLIRWGGGHVFNPSNFGLVLCFLVLGADRAEPLDFWWAPMGPWLGLALALIVCGGLAILFRLRLLEIAAAFWLAFAAGIAVLAATGHAMTARWHLGPITGAYFWWVLLSSPEILVFLFFMITDPKTIPRGRVGRIVYAVSVGLLAVILIAPQRTEYATKVAVLGALAIVCLARPLLRFLPRLQLRSPRRLAIVGVGALVVYAGVLVAAGIPARPERIVAPALGDTGRLPQITIGPSKGVSSKLDLPTARRIAADLIVGLRRRGRMGRTVTTYRLERMRVWLEPGVGQGPPRAIADVTGIQQLATYAGSPPRLVRRRSPTAFRATYELEPNGLRYRIVRVRGVVTPPVRRVVAASFGGVGLADVASKVGLDFRQGAFRFGVSKGDTPAMMGGGLCWLDYDGDGWLDLFVVNSYADADIAAWDERGGLPRSALFHNVRGRFVDVTARSRAGLQVRGEGCVAADLDGDGRTDLFVSTAASDALLWNDGDGTFTEGARAAGVVSFGWHAGAAVGDVNGDGRQDLFVAGYTEAQGKIPGSDRGFPTNHLGVRDLLFLNEGRRRFREVGRAAGLDAKPFDHSLGAVFTDANTDGRLDLYVANDEDPNRLYVNVSRGPLGFRLVDEARAFHVADANAGMGIASADYSGDERPDLFVSNSRGQKHAAYRNTGSGFDDARAAFTPAFGTNGTGWGASWVDLDLDGNLDLAVANGDIPVKDLRRDAGPLEIIGKVRGRFADVSRAVGADRAPRVNGRGLAAADYDNDGHVDLAVNSVGGRLMLLRSSGGKGHWLEVRLPRFAPGAIVTAILPGGRRLAREVHAGSSYLSSEDPRVHFGLGAAETVQELRVLYPGGSVTRLQDVRADRIVVLPRY